MSDAPKTTDSTEGMICPYCNTLWSPDSSSDYNESGFDLDCDDCGGTFHVEPSASWLWLCRPVKAPLKEPEA